MTQREAELFLLEAKAYLLAAKTLRGAEVNSDDNLLEWKTRNPIYFSLLHATELALKAVGLARGKNLSLSHDIVELLRSFSEPSDRAHARHAYSLLRRLVEDRIRNKYHEENNEYAEAALQLELEDNLGTTVALAPTFKMLGALGQSELIKYEFGAKVGRWWHGARYPRIGVQSYPDFDSCVLICETIVRVAEEECTDD